MYFEYYFVNNFSMYHCEVCGWTLEEHICKIQIDLCSVVSCYIYSAW